MKPESRMVKVSSPQFEPSKHVMMCHYKAKLTINLERVLIRNWQRRKRFQDLKLLRMKQMRKKEERRKNETERKKIYRQKLKEKSDLNAKKNDKVGKKKD